MCSVSCSARFKQVGGSQNRGLRKSVSFFVVVVLKTNRTTSRKQRRRQAELRFYHHDRETLFANIKHARLEAGFSHPESQVFGLGLMGTEYPILTKHVCKGLPT